jgi:hypothetical protein
LALAGGLMLTAYVTLAGTTSDVARVKTKADAALAAGQFSAAALHYQHLLALEPDRPSHVVELANVLDRLKRRPEGIAVLSTVAPLPAGGYGPAHLKLAEWIAEAGVMGGDVSDNAVRTAIDHARAATADPALRERADVLIDILQSRRKP